MSPEGKLLRVRVPASTANLGSGFDVLGLGLGMYLDLDLTLRPGPIVVRCSGEGAAALPTDATNLIAQVIVDAGGAAVAGGFELRTHSEIPLTRGFGSSASAIVGGLALAQLARDGALDRDELLRVSTEMEGHPDNVSASIHGGLTVSATIGASVASRSLRLPDGVQIVAITPDRELSTSAARRALPDAWPKADVVFNMQRLAMFITAVHSGEMELLRAGLADLLHQPYRFPLLPQMQTAIEEMSARAGCLGAFISGAGPAIVAFATDNAEQIGTAGARPFIDAGIAASWRVLDVDYEGVRTR